MTYKVNLLRSAYQEERQPTENVLEPFWNSFFGKFKEFKLQQIE